MNFTQIIPFDTSKGGKVPNLCLDNVRLGYGIGGRYASAWEAWENTEQHPVDTIPNGLDVPLYYSYTTTIDNVTENYGHINVRLRNGTVWSDGNIYASIEDYTSKKLPKLVGWGESVNGYKIIQGDEMVTATNCYEAFNGIRMRPPSQQELDQFVGKWTLESLIDALNEGAEREAVISAWKTGQQALKDDWAGQIQRLTDAISADDKTASEQIASIKKILGVSP